MSGLEQLKQTIQANSALTQLFNETVQAFPDYLRAMEPVWAAEEQQIHDMNAAKGKAEYGVPFRIDRLMGKVDPVVLESFMLAQIEASVNDGADLTDAVKELHASYKIAPSGTAPA